MRIGFALSTIPSRAHVLPQALASIYEQTRLPDELMVGVDVERRGPGPMWNRLYSLMDCDWLTTMGDDDLLYPNHLQAMADHADGYDVVYTYCDNEGPSPWRHYNQPFDADLVKERSIVSATALVRAEAFAAVGGYGDVMGEDWDLWLRLNEAGARFLAVPVKTWVYRKFEGGAHRSHADPADVTPSGLPSAPRSSVE